MKENLEDLSKDQLIIKIHRLRRESNNWWGYGIIVGYLIGVMYGIYMGMKECL